MIKCKRCGGRIFIDRVYSSTNHIEIFCILCGFRKFYHNAFKDDETAKWLLMMEISRAKQSISQL